MISNMMRDITLHNVYNTENNKAVYTIYVAGTKSMYIALENSQMHANAHKYTFLYTIYISILFVRLDVSQ